MERAISHQMAMPIVDMPKYVESRQHSREAVRKMLTPQWATRGCFNLKCGRLRPDFVQGPVGWTVRDEDVRSKRNLTPLFTKRRTSSRQVEGPIHEPGLPGRAPNLQAFNLAAGILKVDHIRFQVCARKLRLFLEEPVVIASNDDLPSVWQAIQPLGKFVNLPLRPGIAEITGMNQDIALRDMDAVVEAVGV